MQLLKKNLQEENERLTAELQHKSDVAQTWFEKHNELLTAGRGLREALESISDKDVFIMLRAVGREIAKQALEKYGPTFGEE